MNTNLVEALRVLSEPFSPDAIKTRAGGGGKRLSYVEAHTVIRRLNRLHEFGLTWDWAVTHEDVKKLGEGEDLMVVRGVLSIPGMGSREGYGVQRISARGGEDLVKGASSDALKKAATLFGVGLDLYGPDYEEEQEQQKPRPQAQRPAPVAAREAAPRAEERARAQSEASAVVDPLEVAMRAFANEAGREVAANPGDPQSRPSRTKMERLAASLCAGVIPTSTAAWVEALAALRDRKARAMGGVD